MSYTERCVLLVERPQLTVGTPKNELGTWATDQEIWPGWPAQISVSVLRGANIGGWLRIRIADPLGVSDT